MHPLRGTGGLTLHPFGRDGHDLGLRRARGTGRDVTIPAARRYPSYATQNPMDAMENPILHHALLGEPSVHARTQSGTPDPRNPHPKGKVPLLVHNGVQIRETCAIAL